MNLNTRFILAATILGLSPLFSSCGPSQTSADRDNDQIQATFAKQQRDLAPLVGVYSGTLTSNTGALDITLVLQPAVYQENTPGRGQTSATATLSGNFARCLHGPSTRPCPYIRVTFSQSTYNKNSTPAVLNIQGTLSASDASSGGASGGSSNGSSGGSSGGSGGGSGGGTPQTAIIYLEVHGNHLSGTYSTTGQFIGTLNLDKVQ